VHELRPQFALRCLLKAAGLSRSTFYYQVQVQQETDKYQALKQEIRQIYDQHKGRYGYRRVWSALRQLGHTINHKTVQRLMGELGLKSLVRVKKYQSYKGEAGRTAPNHLGRNFSAKQPNQKWVTDYTCLPLWICSMGRSWLSKRRAALCSQW
jgi:putative transposase